MFHYTDSNPPDQPRILYPNDQPYDIKLDEIFQLKTHQSFDSSTIPSPLSTTDQLLNSISMDNSLMTSVPNNLDVYDFFTSNPVSSSSTLEDNQVTSTVITPPDGQNNYQSEQQSYSQIDTNLQSQTQTSQLSEITTDQMNLNDVTPKQQPTKISNNKINQSLKRSTKHLKQRKSSSSKPICTRCGFKQLIDITQHEFPKQKGLVFECLSCGNNSIRSNVSAEERKIRLAKIAADHLNKINCQFCHRDFHSHNDYITHLRDDHDSNKPM